MQNKIVTGYHTCIDYELSWDYDTLRNLVIQQEIHNSEIQMLDSVNSLRELLINTLFFMIEGKGGEIIPTNPNLCDSFAKNFEYKVTIGGTATRASIAISKLGYPSTVYMCCYNKYFQERLPTIINCIPIKEKTDQIYPHVILQYPKGLQFIANDISFKTTSPNRIMISNDLYSTNMLIPEIQPKDIADSNVFLLSCFSQILELNVLKRVLNRVKENFAKLPKSIWVVFEDGHYINTKFKSLAYSQVRPYADILSMNEEELQDLYGRKINLLNVAEVTQALKAVYTKTGFPNMVVHSKSWAIVFGRDSPTIKKALYFAIGLASTRYKYGDDFGIQEFREIIAHDYEKESTDFCIKMELSMKDNIGCLPSYNLDYIDKPTIVGLGDFFAGGLLIGLMNNPKFGEV